MIGKKKNFLYKLDLYSNTNYARDMLIAHAKQGSYLNA